MSKRQRMINRNKARREQEYRNLLADLFDVEEVASMSADDVADIGWMYRRELSAERKEQAAKQAEQEHKAAVRQAKDRRDRNIYLAECTAKRIAAMI